MSQSSNDVIPTAIHLSAALAVRRVAAAGAERTCADAMRNEGRRRSADVAKTGRTHLMDAMPITFGQELGGWAAQIRSGIERVRIGAAAAARVAARRHRGRHRHQRASGVCSAYRARNCRRRPGLALRPNDNFFESLVVAGHRGGTVGSAQSGRGQHHEDRQRSAMDEQRTARGSRRNRTDRRCNPAAASCRARSIR